jgi:uncharacterized protein
MVNDCRITIRFYEELNDFIRNYSRKKEIHYTSPGRRSVKDLIESFGVPHTEVDLIMVNGSPVDFTYIVENNNRISVYPVFERLNIRGLSPLRKSPLRESRFVLDVHLGKLARDLRMLGFDTDYKTFRDDRELAEISSREKRILLTRDRQLLMRKIVRRGLIIRSDNPNNQIVEILNRLDLQDDIKPFTRCISCNGVIEKLKEESENYNMLFMKIPLKVLDWAQEYTYCPSCLKVYWKGSHYDSLMTRITNLMR